MSEAIKSIDKFCGIDDKTDVVKDEYVINTIDERLVSEIRDQVFRLLSANSIA